MEKINIAELLKDCPEGMGLDCTMFEDNCVEFDDIVNDKFLPIRCRIKDSNGGYNYYNFTKYGCWIIDSKAKCVIFPKGKTTWEGFQRPFKDGDIVAFDTEKGAQLFIFKEYIHDHWYAKSAKCYMMLDCGGEIDFESGGYYVERLATEEEKSKLFDAIKEHGYKWNEETKTLEKVVESRFHAGDWITDGISKYQILFIDDIQYWYSENGILGSIESVDKRYHHWTIQDAEDGDVLAFDDDTIVIFKDLYNKTTFHSYCHIEDGVFSISELDCPDWWDIKFKPATKEQRDFLFQKIKEAGYRWNAEIKTLEKLVEPKFKVGDIITKRDSIENSWVVSSVSSEYYGLQLPKGSEGIGTLPIIDQDKYELIPNKFDITTLKPFDNCKYSLDNGRTWKFAQYWYIMDNYKIDDIKIELWQD